MKHKNMLASKLLALDDMNDLSSDMMEIVEEAMPSLDPEKIYRLKDLYGKEKWAELNAIGRAFSDDSLNEMLCCSDWGALDCVGENHKNWSLYKVRSTYIHPDSMRTKTNRKRVNC